MRRVVLAAALVIGAGVGTLSLPASGQDVPPHNHYIVLANGTRVPVGPQVCDNPRTQEGFNHFHANVHLGTPNAHAFQNGNNPVSFAAAPC